MTTWLIGCLLRAKSLLGGTRNRRKECLAGRGVTYPEIKQETLRRIVESGKEIDTDVIEKVVRAGGDTDRTGRDLKVSGLIVCFVAPGLVILGWFLSQLDERLWGVMLGVAGLVLLEVLLSSPLQNSIGAFADMLEIPIVNVSNPWMVALMAPLNSVAGVVGVLLLGFHTLYRRSIR